MKTVSLAGGWQGVSDRRDGFGKGNAGAWRGGVGIAPRRHPGTAAPLQRSEPRALATIRYTGKLTPSSSIDFQLFPQSITTDAVRLLEPDPALEPGAIAVA